MWVFSIIKLYKIFSYVKWKRPTEHFIFDCVRSAAMWLIFISFVNSVKIHLISFIYNIFLFILFFNFFLVLLSHFIAINHCNYNSIIFIILIILIILIKLFIWLFIIMHISLQWTYNHFAWLLFSNDDPFMNEGFSDYF